MDTIYKTFRGEVKEINESEGTIDMFIPVSTDSVDRDGEVIEPTAFKKTLPKFMKRPVLVASHDYRDLTNQIGEWSKLRISEEGMNGKPKYYINEGNEQANWGFKLASRGMAAFSIGFIPKVWEDGDGEKSPRRTFKEVELLEISQVIIPSNRDAIQGIRAKSADPIVMELCDEVEGEIDAEEMGEKEIVTKPEETDELIRIPVRECEVTATIDISKREGISALYCGREKQVRTYLFRKDKGWTMEKARAWVKEHEGKQFDDLETEEVEIEDEVVKFPLDESGGWDVGKEVATAEVSDLKIMCAIVVGDPENKTSYKLPHHRAGGEHAVVWRAVANCAAVLMGARGGVDAPSEQISKAKSHIKGHYSDFDKGSPPWEKAVSQEFILDEMDYIAKLVEDNGMSEEVKDTLRSLLDAEVKAGAVLNKVNKDRLNKIKVLAQEVLDSAGTEEEEKRSPADDIAVNQKDIDNEEEKEEPREPTYEELLAEIQNINIGG